MTGQGQYMQVLAGVHISWCDCILTLGNVCKSAVLPKRRSEPLSYKENSSQRGLGVLAFDGTFSLIRHGVDGIITPSRLKPMPFRKVRTGWSSRSSHATFEPWKRGGRYETHVRSSLQHCLHSLSREADRRGDCTDKRRTDRGYGP